MAGREYQAQRLRTPAVTLWTVPTAAEASGDFSRSLNANGSLRTVYDPYTTVFNAATGTATRTPFVGNRIPSSRFDPLGARWMTDIASLGANRNPDNLTGVNNYSYVSTGRTNYWDLSERVDYYATEKLRFFARPSIYRTNALTVPAGSLLQNEIYVQPGSTRNGLTVPGQVLWTPTATTVVDISGNYRSFVDQFVSPAADGPDPYIYNAADKPVQRMSINVTEMNGAKAPCNIGAFGPLCILFGGHGHLVSGAISKIDKLLRVAHRERGA